MRKVLRIPGPSPGQPSFSPRDTVGGQRLHTRPQPDIPFKSRLPNLPCMYNVDLIMLLPRQSDSTGNSSGEAVVYIVSVVLFIFFVTICFCGLSRRQNAGKETRASPAAIQNTTKKRAGGKSANTSHIVSNKPGPFADTAPMLPTAAHLGEGHGDGEYEMSAYGDGGLGIVRTETEEWERK
jgi:hypothetical protein